MARSKENVSGAENSILEDGARSAPTLSSMRSAGPAAASRQSLDGNDQHEEIETTSPIQLSLSPARKAVSNP